MGPFDRFDANAVGFHSCNALALGQAATLAYSDSNAVRNTLASWGFDGVRLLDHRDTQGFIARNAGILLVAFRGTEPKQILDWLTNIDVRLVAGPAGMVHQGFLGALFDVWWELRPALDELQDPGQPRTLWLTGHSLGGALATLATAKLRLEENLPVGGLYTFGSPRVGDRPFAARFQADFKSRTVRFVNNHDLVTRVPQRLLGYDHVGVEGYFDANGVFELGGSGFLRFLAEVTVTMPEFRNLPASAFADHSMARYVALLKNQCP
jgi:triacylglycerol lipase